MEGMTMKQLRRMIRWWITEKLFWWIAFHLPEKIVYFATIRLVAYATGDEKYKHTIVPELPAMEAIGRWEKDKKLYRLR
jgi:hypothetical protein